jgi:hypothetical protein
MGTSFVAGSSLVPFGHYTHAANVTHRPHSRSNALDRAASNMNAGRPRPTRSSTPCSRVPGRLDALWDRLLRVPGAAHVRVCGRLRRDEGGRPGGPRPHEPSVVCAPDEGREKGSCRGPGPSRPARRSAGTASSRWPTPARLPSLRHPQRLRRTTVGWPISPPARLAQWRRFVNAAFAVRTSRVQPCPVAHDPNGIRGPARLDRTSTHV